MLKVTSPKPARRTARGVLLIEVMVSILIFALGVLGLVRLQAMAIQQSSQARYRTEATMLANDLIGQMWITDRTTATIAARFSSGPTPGADYTAWKTRVAALPGTAASAPVVTVAQIPLPFGIAGGASAPAPTELLPSTRVNVTVFWQAPGDSQHQVTLTNEIR